MIQLQVDVMLLQETHLTSMRDVRGLESKASIAGLPSSGKNRVRGVAILFLPKFQGRITKYQWDDKGRLLTVDVVLRGKAMRATNVYAPVDCGEQMFFTGTCTSTYRGDGS